jgi:hypothetical protein
MNKTLFLFHLFLLPLILLISSCDGERLRACSGGDCEHILFPNANLIITEDTIIQRIEIGPGNKLVFEHRFEKNDKANIADDEFWDWIFFEIDPDLESFSFSDAELTDINALYEFSCFCVGPFRFRIESGTISGEKKGDKWDVTVDVEIDRNGQFISKSFSATYRE